LDLVRNAERIQPKTILFNFGQHLDENRSRIQAEGRDASLFPVSFSSVIQPSIASQLLPPPWDYPIPGESSRRQTESSR
jgi:hypothetical protein